MKCQGDEWKDLLALAKRSKHWKRRDPLANFTQFQQGLTPKLVFYPFTPVPLDSFFHYAQQSLTICISFKSSWSKLSICDYLSQQDMQVSCTLPPYISLGFEDSLHIYL